MRSMRPGDGDGLGSEFRQAANMLRAVIFGVFTVSNAAAASTRAGLARPCRSRSHSHTPYGRDGKVFSECEANSRWVAADHKARSRIATRVHSEGTVYQELVVVLRPSRRNRAIREVA